jgi:hypothetical protein
LTSTDLTIGGAFILGTSVTLSTGAGAGNILLSSTTAGTAGTENLTVNSGTGTQTFTGAVSSITNIIVTNSAALTFSIKALNSG